jgi:hypothetical protein
MGVTYSFEVEWNGEDLIKVTRRTRLNVDGDTREFVDGFRIEKVRNNCLGSACGPHPEVVYAVTTSDGGTERFDTLSEAIDHLIELLERPPEVARLLMRLSVLGDVKVVSPS